MEQGWGGNNQSEGESDGGIIGYANAKSYMNLYLKRRHRRPGKTGEPNPGSPRPRPTQGLALGFSGSPAEGLAGLQRG